MKTEGMIQEAGASGEAKSDPRALLEPLAHVLAVVIAVGAVVAAASDLYKK